jgi:hypothetical protein
MTMTKIAYLIAAIVPFGFVVLAGFLLLRAMAERRAAQPVAAGASSARATRNRPF